MRTIETKDVVRRIQTENPWWADAPEGGIEAWALQPREYFHIFLPLVENRTVKRAVVLLGPRRVGKTVMLHHVIQSLIRAGAPANTIAYVSIDNPVYSQLEFESMLGLIARASGARSIRGLKFIFLDEIQYLRDWERHLKTAVDEYPQIRFVVSGSAAATLRLRSTESGAGRFTDFLLPPLTFHEFLALTHRESVIEPAPSGNQWAIVHDLEQLNSLFIDYLNFGGYPEAIFVEAVRTDPARFIKSDIIDKVLLRDLPSLYGIRDIQELNYLFTTLAFNTAGEVSLEDLSKRSGVAKNTIKKYIEYLESAFLVKIINRVDRNARRFQRATHFKVYLTNPSMRAALFSPVSDTERTIEQLAETAIFAQWFHSQSAPLHYARWDKGEVDIVAVDGNQRARWAVEVKWSDRYFDRPSELASLLTFCRETGLTRAAVTTITKAGTKSHGGVELDFVPAAVYCYTVGYNLVRNLRLEAFAETPPKVKQGELHFPSNPVDA